MHLSRRGVIGAAFGAAALGAGVSRPTEGHAEAALNDDGLHTQPWFHNSFLDLNEDVAEAHEGGKALAILWEQRGCPYCRELHQVNLARPEISKYIQDNFVVLQLNLYGARSVTDFDGQEMEERELARRWRVNFTPTLSFFAKDPAASEGNPAAMPKFGAYLVTGNRSISFRRSAMWPKAATQANQISRSG